MSFHFNSDVWLLIIIIYLWSLKRLWMLPNVSVYIMIAFHNFSVREFHIWMSTTNFNVFNSITFIFILQLISSLSAQSQENMLPQKKQSTGELDFCDCSNFSDLYCTFSPLSPPLVSCQFCSVNYQNEDKQAVCRCRLSLRDLISECL